MRTSRQIRCAIYTRKSTEEGLEQDFNSLDAQREACVSFIASQKSEGWIALPASYDDGGYSGGTLQRPALQSLLKDIENGLVDVVVVYKIDRLSRSLMDFAKLVEVFDRKNVTFVSVTQSFNTTTSMGRLTLNVLLSFAQFEREVTGERIRDKFAASRKKGMWMGGVPPLGYDIGDRRLVVNADEAKNVRLIYQRYLDLGCVRALRDDLKSKGIVAKIWTSTTGRTHGGSPMNRGALYCLLKNRLYLGEVVHKGNSYPGEHEAIVDKELFDAVELCLADGRQRQRGQKGHPQNAVLTGILFDSTGGPMVPTYSTKGDGRRYRYYISRSYNGSERPAIPRIPAPALEYLIRTTLVRLRLPSGHSEIRGTDSSDIRIILRRIEIGASSIAIGIDRDASLGWWRTTVPGAETFQDNDLIEHHREHFSANEQLIDDGRALKIVLPVRAKFRGGRSALLSSPRGPRTDPALVTALARAHRWKQLLMDGKISSVTALAKSAGIERRHAGRTLALAFLSPEIATSILDGTQPPSLRLSHLLDANIPHSWRDQRELIAELASDKGFGSAPS